MDVSVSVPAIAVIFFLVTMALAVGPLLLCRLFVGSAESCEPRPGKSWHLTVVLTACGYAVAVAAAVAGMYFLGGSSTTSVVSGADRPATEVDSTVVSAWAVGSQRSLFDGQRLQPVTTAGHRSVDVRMSWAGILLPLLLATAVVSLLLDRLRGGLLRLLPVALVGGLLVVLFLRFSMQHEHERAEAAQGHAMEQTLLVEGLMEMESAPERELSAQETGQQAAAVATRNPDHQVTDASVVDPPTPAGTADTVVVPDESTAAPEITEYVGTDDVGVPRETLPAWTDEIDAVGRMQVIRSGPHATVELAERHALAELRSLMLDRFIKQHPEARGWQPPDDVVLHSGSILRRAVERSQITVGDFTNPMYEASWQVDPTIGTVSLANAWRPTVVHERLAWLGGGIGLLTLLLGSLAAGLRVDEQTGGQRRKALTFATLALWTLVGGAAWFVA